MCGRRSHGHQHWAASFLPCVPNAPVAASLHLGRCPLQPLRRSHCGPVAENHSDTPVFIEDPEGAATALSHAMGEGTIGGFCPLPRLRANL